VQWPACAAPATSARRYSSSSPGLSFTAWASRSTVETRGSRLPASIRLTSVACTPLRSATCSWLISNLRRACRRFGPSFPTRWIVKAGAFERHRASHKAAFGFEIALHPSRKKNGTDPRSQSSGRDRPLGAIKRACKSSRLSERAQLWRSSSHPHPLLRRCQAVSPGQTKDAKEESSIG
jgi:hypothetical protein